MGEKEPRPEINDPLIFKCENCGNNERTTAENTTLFMYEEDKEKNHLKTECFAREGYVSVHFLNWDDEQQRLWAAQFDYAVDDEGNVPKTCDDEALVAVWRDHHGIKAHNEYELTGSQIKKCDFLKYLMETMPDEDIQAEFSEPMPPRTYPESWR